MRFATGLLILGLGLAPLPAFAVACPPPPGNGNICTANDFTVTGVTVSGATECTEGETINGVTVRVSLNSTAKENYDVGFFVGDNGGEVFNGQSCRFDSLTPLAPPLDLTGGRGGFRDLDGDACGDVQKSETTVREIRLDNVLCRDSDGDGRLDIQGMVSWSSNKTQDVCSDPANPASFFPDQSSKCQMAPNLDLGIVVEPPASIEVTKTVSPETLQAPGGSVQVVVTVQNTSSATDPITLDSLIDVPHGDLNGRGTCATGFTLAPGDFYQCEFSHSVSGASGYSETDTVTATGHDDEGAPVSDSESATVTIIGQAPPPSLRVAKIALPRQRKEPGGTVLYVLLLRNTSSQASIQIGTVTDRVGSQPPVNVLSLGTCASLDDTPLPPGGSRACAFTQSVTGQPGDVITDRVTVIGTADTGENVSASDDASVSILDVPSALLVEKQASPTSLAAPGGSVRFAVSVQNVSPVDTVTLNSLVDAPYGDLTQASNSTCALPQVLAPSAFYNCAFDGNVSGNAISVMVDVVTASGVDDDGVTVVAKATAAVTILSPSPPDLPSALTVRKIAQPVYLFTPGGNVKFFVVVTNASATDTVTLTSLQDDVFGDLTTLPGTTCTLPQSLAIGASYACQFTRDLRGNAGDTHWNVLTASGIDDDNEAVSAANRARVRFIEGITPVPPSAHAIPTLSDWMQVLTALAIAGLVAARLRA
jgi:hypothetical protein